MNFPQNTNSQNCSKRKIRKLEVLLIMFNIVLVLMQLKAKTYFGLNIKKKQIRPNNKGICK